MSHVFVIDQDKQPLDPIHPGHARKLLSSGKAAVYRRFPFVLIRKHQVSEPHPQPLRLKIDPGSKTTGLAVLNNTTGQVVWESSSPKRLAGSIPAEPHPACGDLGSAAPALVSHRSHLLRSRAL